MRSYRFGEPGRTSPPSRLGLAALLGVAQPDYLPLSVGARWEYDVSYFIPLVGSGKAKAVSRIESIQMINGRSYFKEITLFDGLPLPSEVSYYRKANDGVYVLREKYMQVGEQLMLPIPPTSNRTWTQSWPDGTVTFKLEGTENVPLLERSYDGCLKVAASKGTSGQGWVAYTCPDVGTVKQEIYEGGLKTLDLSLAKYTR